MKNLILILGIDFFKEIIEVELPRNTTGNIFVIPYAENLY